MTKRDEEQALSEKEQEIVAVGASIASGCVPCTKFHLRAAAGVGVSPEEIRRAVEEAVAVRNAATGQMAEAGGLSRAGAGREIPAPAPTRIGELVAIAAAYAVNWAQGLEAHMKAARALGASDAQMYAAIRIACAVREVACQKAKIAAGLMLGVSEEEALACDCREDEEPVAAAVTECAPGETGGAACGCRPGAQEIPTDSEKTKRRKK